MKSVLAADLYQLAGIVAVQSSGGPDIPFTAGMLFLALIAKVARPEVYALEHHCTISLLTLHNMQMLTLYNMQMSYGPILTFEVILNAGRKDGWSFPPQGAYLSPTTGRATLCICCQSVDIVLDIVCMKGLKHCLHDLLSPTRTKKRLTCCCTLLIKRSCLACFWAKAGTSISLNFTNSCPLPIVQSRLQH